jgi:hypothetical protein
MPYTISSTLDINAQVDVGNLQFITNTISSTNTDGNIILSPNGTGNVGISTTSPAAKLDISGNTDGSVQAILTRGNDTDFQLQAINESSTNTPGVIVSKFGVRHGTNRTALFNFIRGHSGYDGSLAIETNNSERMRIDSEGNVGIGTGVPHAMLHVAGQGTNRGSLSSANRRYFSGNGTFTSASGTGEHGGIMSIYAWSRIVTSDYVVAHGSSSFSDRRIKDNIVDVENDVCLQKLRLLKPKQYTYRDTLKKGTTPVWGFIAQEVAEIMDYAVEKMQKAIPNVYKLASVSQDGTVLTFDTPVTLEHMDSIKLQLKTLVHEEHDVTVLEVINSTSISLTEPLKDEYHTGTINGESINRKVFVYGQYVDDFHVLKKDAIFTLSVAALQEIDRRQTVDNEHILELETENSLQEERITTLEAQVAALLQHTGVTV